MSDIKENNARTSEVIISLTALVLFGVLFTVTELFRSPFLVFAIIIFILYPFRKSKLIKTLLSLSLIIFLVWIFNSISQLLFPFIVAFILSYALNPLIDVMNKRNLSRTISSLLIMLAFLAIIALLVIFLAPLIVAQFTDLINSIPLGINSLGNWLNTVVLPRLSSMGIPTMEIQEKIVGELPGSLEKILNTLFSSLSGIFTGLSVVLTQVVNLILIPFLTFYILKDFDKIKELVKEMVPKQSRDAVTGYYRKIDKLLGGFIRGSIICAVIHGILAFTFLSILGIKYAIFLSALSALLNLIPYFGLLISMTLATIVALFSGNPGVQVPLVILLYLGQNLLETSFIVPKIVGERIGLHPALLILSLLVFSYFYGFVGLLIALPVTSVILMFFKEWLDKRKSAAETI